MNKIIKKFSLMDTENEVHLHSEILFSYYKQWHEFCRQVDGTRKYPEWGNSDPKGHAWYVLTDKCILAKKFGIPKI